MSNEIFEDKNFEKFLLSKFQLECFLTIPFVIYLIYLGYIYLQLRKMTLYFHKTFNYSLGLKKNWILLLIIFFSYEIFYIFHTEEHILISDQLYFILTIFVKIFCCVYIIVVINEQAVKNMKNRSMDYIFFFILVSFLLFLEIINEFLYEVV